MNSGQRNGGGTPYVYTWDYSREEKRPMSGTRAAWSLLHKRAPTLGLIVYRACRNPVCVSPRHMREGERWQMGANMRGRALAAEHADRCCINVRNAWLARGIVPTAPEIVAAIRAADQSVTGTELARLYGIGRSTVSKIRRGESHRAIATCGIRLGSRP